MRYIGQGSGGQCKSEGKGSVDSWLLFSHATLPCIRASFARYRPHFALLPPKGGTLTYLQHRQPCETNVCWGNATNPVLTLTAHDASFAQTSVAPKRECSTLHISKRTTCDASFLPSLRFCPSSQSPTCVLYVKRHSSLSAVSYHSQRHRRARTSMCIPQIWIRTIQYLLELKALVTCMGMAWEHIVAVVHTLGTLSRAMSTVTLPQRPALVVAPHGEGLSGPLH